MHKYIQNNSRVETISAREYESNILIDYVQSTIRKVISLDVQQIKIYLSIAYFILVSMISLTLFI